LFSVLWSWKTYPYKQTKLKATEMGNKTIFLPYKTTQTSKFHCCSSAIFWFSTSLHLCIRQWHGLGPSMVLGPTQCCYTVILHFRKYTKSIPIYFLPLICVRVMEATRRGSQTFLSSVTSTSSSVGTQQQPQARWDMWSLQWILGLPGGLPWVASGRYPDQMPEPPQLAPFNPEEQRLCFEPLQEDQAPHPIHLATLWRKLISATFFWFPQKRVGTKID